MSDWPQKFLHAYSERHHYDSVSAEQASLTLADAYDIQHRFVVLRREPISGYKAALTAIAAQQAMSVAEPIVGVLFSSGEFNPKNDITPQQQSLLETELGFIAAQDITAPVSPAKVFESMACCMPMIEVASPNLATKPNGLDLIATNSASYGYLKGPEFSLAHCDFDAQFIRLASDEETLLSGQTNEVLGGQREALTWLINQVLARGYEIEAGHILMTGSIGGMHPAKPGQYVADFDKLGQLSFTITAQPN